MTAPTRREQLAAMRSKHRIRYRTRRRLELLAACLISPLVAGWGLMITIGILHRDWWHAIPTMGLRTAWIIMAILAAVFALLGLISTYIRE